MAVRCAPIRLVLAALVWLPSAFAQLNFNSGPFGPGPIAATTYALTPSGGTSPYTFSYAPSATLVPGFQVVNRPNVPYNLSASATGALVGLPPAAGTFNTTIRVTDNLGAFVDKPVTVVVTPVDIAGFSTGSYSIGDFASILLFGVGGTPPYTYSVTSGALPASTTLNPASGLISGTLTSSGSSFTFKVQDAAANSYSRGYSLSASPLRITNVPGRQLPNGTVNQLYSFTFIATGGSPPCAFSLDSGNLPAGLTLSSTGTISGTPTGTVFGGDFSLRVADSASHVLVIRLALNILPETPAPLTITTSAIMDASVGGALGGGGDTAIWASGGLPPYTFDLAPGSILPAGAIVNSFSQGPTIVPNRNASPAYIYGRVQVPGDYSFTIRVMDSVGNVATRPINWYVAPLTFLQSSVPAGGAPTPVLGTPYTHYLLPVGGTPPYTLTPADIPAGMTVDNTGVLAGTPMEVGQNLPLSVRVQDSGGNHWTSSGSMTINSPTAANLYLDGGDFGTLQKGNQYSRTLNCTGSPLSPPNYNVTLVSGSLPPGLVLLTGTNFNHNFNPNAAAQIAGTPAAADTFSFILQVTDGAGNIGQRQIRMRVSNLAFVNQGIAPGTVGVPYNQTFDVRGGSLPYSFSVTSGNLPTGLSIDPATGTISATPTTTAAASVTVRVQDAAGDSITRSYTLNIYSLQITNNSATPLPLGIYGLPYTPYTFTASPAAAYTWTASGLPSGMTLNAAIGVLSGTPLGTGAYTISITAGNGATSVTKNFTLFTWYRWATNWLYGMATAPLGPWVVGSTVNAALGLLGGVPPYTISLVPPSTLPPGLSLVPANTYNPTSGFGRWAIAGIPAAPGTYNARLRYADSSGLVAERTVTIVITTLALATTTLRPVVVNTPYSTQLFGVGGSGPYAFVLADLPSNVLPPGLSLTPTGLLSGTPTSTGSFSFTLLMTSGAANRLITVSLSIAATPDGRRLELNFGPVLTDRMVGASYVSALTPSGGAGTHWWTIASGSLPPGIVLLSGANLPAGYAPPTAVLAGPPSMPGTYSFAIRVDDSTGNFAIRNATQVITPIGLGPVNVPYSPGLMVPPMQVGVPYSFTFVGINGRAPYTYTTTSGTSLPPGITFSSMGALSGTPAEAGDYALNFLITDANGATRRLVTGSTVLPAVRPIGLVGFPGSSVPFALPSGIVGTGYVFTLNDLVYPPWSGTPPVTWTLASGSGPLPPGLTITPGLPSATLTGTPSTPGNYAFSLLATDANGAQHLAYNLSLKVSLMGLAPAPGTLPPAVAGTAYSQAFIASGGTPPYTYRLAYNSSLPLGLALSSGGVLSGTPATVGWFVLWIEAVDSLNNVFPQRYTLVVSPPGTIIPALTVNPASINASYTVGNPAPAPIPINLGSTATSLGFTVTSSGGVWLSVAPASGTTPATVNATLNVAGLPVGFYSGVITASSAAASNSPVAIPVTLSVAAAAPCECSISPASGSIPAAGGSGSFNVTTGPTCNWTATASQPWISVNSPGSGTGSGTVGFTVQQNTLAATRTGTIQVQGLTYTVTQFGTACAFTLNPTSVSVAASGGTGLITVNASASDCAWTATPVEAWITISGAASGVGSGSVTISVAANGSSSRAGTVNIGGQVLTVNQAGVACTYSLSSAGASMPSSGGSTSVNMTAPAGCAWTVDPGPSWNTVVSGASGSGPGTVEFSIAANSTTVARSAGALIGGQNYQITQAGLPCSFSLSANNPMQPAAGGSGNVDITASGGSCGWVASSNAEWLTLSTTSGTGSGSLAFNVAMNSNPAARSATLTVAGQNIIVNQAGLVCSYTLRSPSASMPSAGGPSSVGVIAATGCAWTATSATGWIVITGGGSSSGTANVDFNVQTNPTGVERSGVLTIAGQAFAVTQAPAACTITLTPSSYSAGQFGGSSSFTYTTSVSDCPHTVQSFTSWVKVTSASYGGMLGSVNFTVDANTYAAGRSGIIKVGDQDFTVNQAASTCAYTLQSLGATFWRLGGEGAASTAFAPPACGPPAVLVLGPPGMITLGSITPGSGTYTQNYSVGIYQSFINYTRTAQLLISGQIYTVKQNSWDQY